jgi:hypothetical protein
MDGSRTSDKVQGMSAVGAVQPAGHDKPNAIGSIVPALAKSARTGTHDSVMGRKTPSEEWATRL